MTALAREHPAAGHGRGGPDPRWLLRRATAEPRRVLDESARVLAPGTRGTADRSLVEHARALAFLELGEPARAQHSLDSARAAAVRARGGPGTASGSSLRLTSAWVRLRLGDTEGCLAHLDHLARRPDPGVRARAHCVRAVVACSLGEWAEAVGRLDRALRALAARGDRRWLAIGCNARAVACGYLGREREGERGLRRAERIWEALGETPRLAACRDNRGFLALRRGDVAAALRAFDGPTERAGGHRGDPGALVDRAEALIAAGLLREAGDVLDEVVSRAEESRDDVARAEALVTRASCELARGRPDLAVGSARSAARLSRARRGAAWVVLADALVCRASLSLGGPAAPDLAAAERVAMACRRRGWHSVAVGLLLAVGRLAAERGVAHEADRALRAASDTAEDYPGGDRLVTANGLLARGLRALGRGDAAAAGRAATRGMAVVDTDPTLRAAVELRGRALEVSSELATVGLVSAVRAGEPAAALRFVERHRARTESVGPGGDRKPPCRGGGRGASPGQPAVGSPPSAGTESGRWSRDAFLLRRRLTELRAVRRTRGEEFPASAERAVAEQALRRASGQLCAPRAPVPPEVLPDLLLDRCLVSFSQVGGRLVAATVVAGSEPRWCDLGTTREIAAEVGYLRAGLVQLVATPRGRLRGAAAGAVARSSAALDRVLLGPLRGALADRGVVVVPTGPLHSMPWAALPGLADRPVVVTSSVSAWAEGERAGPRGAVRMDGPALWVAGPGLPAAEREVRVLARRFGGRTLVGGAATASAVLTAARHASLVHVAGHGALRRDRPLLSGLVLADGTVCCHDLAPAGGRGGPDLVVLAACDLGLASVGPGGAATGVPAAVLAGGARTLIASVLPVPDGRTAAVMGALYRNLARGQSPAAALAGAGSATGERGFVCLGVG
ncbi:CHAT domain-containing protein [Actinoalloteichus caeruleus]|uniref:CHAT domain-containing protein n=1 Tax=Actinoalloteichus cyanogriseus TaxID=2893586 RepID=UPI0004BF6C85|nr:CHAT domain-containing protein [Actinoalloteichus caeruleus]